MAERPPHLLFITADQWRGDALGVAGQPWLQTPHLDRLAREGYFFPRCYSECPVCIAARMVWLTGQHPWATGSRTNRQVPLDDTATLPALLGGAGYATRGLGKMHFGPPDCRQTHGFDATTIVESGRCAEPDDYHRFLARTPWAGLSRGHGVGNNDVFATVSAVPEPYHVNSWVAGLTIDFLEQHAARSPDTPFLVSTSYSKPHSPYDPPRPYDSLYQVWDVPRPGRRPGDFSEGPPYLADLAAHYGWPSLGEEQTLVARCHYHGQITHLDHTIGRLVAALERLGLRDDTVILFNADHGDLLGDHNLFFKGNFYEESTHVPLILHVPEPLRRRLGLPAPRTVEALCGLVDVVPTLLELAGLPLPPALDTRGLLPLVRGEEERVAVDGVYGYDAAQTFMLREPRWKYVYWALGGYEQLFDTVADPAELHNLAHDPDWAAERRRLRQALVDRLRRRGATAALDGADLVRYPWDGTSPRWPAAKGPWGRRPS